MYGIERSAIADQAELIVRDNGYDDRVTIIKGEQSLLRARSVMRLARGHSEVVLGLTATLILRQRCQAWRERNRDDHVMPSEFALSRRLVVALVMASRFSSGASYSQLLVPRDGRDRNHQRTRP